MGVTSLWQVNEEHQVYLAPSNAQQLTKTLFGALRNILLLQNNCKVKGDYHAQNLKMVILEPVAMFLHWRVFRF